MFMVLGVFIGVVEIRFRGKDEGLPGALKR